MFRVGLGWDLHRLVKGRPLVIGGIRIPYAKGEKAHSDGDVLLHAVTDALLGACGMGDIGSFFPPEDQKWKNADSKFLLKTVWEKIRAGGWELENLDCVLILQKPKILPFRVSVGDVVRFFVRTDPGNVTIIDEQHTATSTSITKTFEGLECVGKGRAVQSFCTALLSNSSTDKGIQEEKIGIARAAETLKKGKQDLSRVLNNRAGILEASGDYSGAEALYGDLMENHDKSTAGYYNYGLFLLNRGKMEASIGIITEGLSFFPEAEDLWELKGLAEIESGKYKTAVSSFSSAIAVNPGKFSLWNNRGVAFFKLEDYENAVSSFKEALNLNKDDYDIWFNLRDAALITGDTETVALCEKEMKRLETE